MKKLKEWILSVVLISVACIFLAPLIWMIMTSFKPPHNLFSLPPNLWVEGGMGL